MLTKVAEVFLVFLRLGLTSFGGPVAHLGYFHHELIQRRRWLEEAAYADLVALCQFLPGPASSQVGIAIGLRRAGALGALAAWIGFTLPSALLLIAFGYGANRFQGHLSNGLLHGLKLVAVPIVAQAIWAMGSKLCTDRLRASIAAAGAVIVSLFPAGPGQVFAILLGGLGGLFLRVDPSRLPPSAAKPSIGPRVASLSLLSFGALLMLLPILAKVSLTHSLKLFDSFYRAGSLVFGGGHVVLPLLKSEVVASGWVTADSFMLGYGAAQAMPGPLFAFAAYLGAVSLAPPNGWTSALLCLIAVFLPSFFLVFGALPYWEKMRRYDRLRSAMQGIGAVVVGLLLAAFYDPVWTSAIYSSRDFALAAMGFVALAFWKVPPWVVVILTAIIS